MALALSSAPGLNHWVQSSFTIVAAVAIAWLGHSAQDCPPNCPGTNGHANPVRQISIKFTKLS